MEKIWYLFMGMLLLGKMFLIGIIEYIIIFPKINSALLKIHP